MIDATQSLAKVEELVPPSDEIIDAIVWPLAVTNGWIPCERSDVGGELVVTMLTNSNDEVAASATETSKLEGALL